MVPRNCKPSCCKLKWNVSPKSCGISTVTITEKKRNLTAYETAEVMTQGFLSMRRSEMKSKAAMGVGLMRRNVR